MRRYPDGVCHLGPPAPPAALAQAEASLGRTLPRPLADFLAGQNGATLFHEDIVLYDLETLVAENGGGAAPGLADLLCFCESANDERYLIEDSGRIYRFDGESESVILAATSLERLLGRFMALGKLLYDAEGEFREGVIAEDGESLDVHMRVKLAKRAIAVDKGAALGYEELGRGLKALGRLDQAAAAFGQAAAVDPGAIWSAFDCGRILFTQATSPAGAPSQMERAEALFVQAAQGGRNGDHPYAPFFWAWAALAAERRGASQATAAHRARVRRLAPDFAARQVEAAQAALAEGEQDEARLFLALALTVEPGHLSALSLRRSLPNFGV